VERAGLEGGDAFANERATAVNEARLFCSVFEGLARNLVVVGFEWRAAEVSSPPEKAMPTFSPTGRDSRITDMLAEPQKSNC
jgi:hypothetical protein